MSVDRWLLQILSGPEAVGSYTAAYLIVFTPIYTLGGRIGPLAYSMAVRTHEFESKEATNANLAQNLVILLAVVLPSAAGVVAVSDNLARLTVAPFYWSAIVSLAPWLSATAVVTAIRNFYIDTSFQLAHRNTPLLAIAIFAVALNVALDMWLIPPLGVLGAAICNFVAVLSSSIVAAIVSRFVFPLPLPVLDTTKVVASAGVMFLVVHRLSAGSGPWALACQIVAGCIVYSCLVIVFNILNVRGWMGGRLPDLRRWALARRP